MQMDCQRKILFVGAVVATSAGVPDAEGNRSHSLLP